MLLNVLLYSFGCLFGSPLDDTGRVCSCLARRLLYDLRDGSSRGVSRRKLILGRDKVLAKYGEQCQREKDGMEKVDD